MWYTGAAGKAGLYYVAAGSDGGSLAPDVALVTGSHLPAVHGSVVGLAGVGAVAAFDAAPGGGRAIGIAQVDPAGRPAGRATLLNSDGGVYPQLALASARTAVVAYTARSGERQELRLARVVLPGGDR